MPNNEVVIAKCPLCSAPYTCPPKISVHRGPQLGKCRFCGFEAHADYWRSRAGVPSAYENIPFEPKTHELKVLPQYYYAHLLGLKNFEIRKNDRGYRAGHTALLRMYTPEKGYHDKVLAVEITYVTDYPDGLKPGYVVLATRRI